MSGFQVFKKKKETKLI